MRRCETVRKGIVKHQHGTPNEILRQEEEAMLAAVNRALASTSNAQTIGRNGEIPLRDFLNRYLPYTLRAATGHFMAPNGELSPQIDVIILDARYPLLAENADSSVLAMLHSVVGTFEVKTRLATHHIGKICKDAIRIMSLAEQVKGYAGNGWGDVMTNAFAYGCVNKLDALAAKYEKECKPDQAGLDISILRLHPSDQAISTPLGIELHFEPTSTDDSSDTVCGYVPLRIPQFTPLSDLYYTLVQNAYYTLGRRNHSLSDIGQHVMDYMSWSSCTLEKYYKLKANMHQ